MGKSNIEQLNIAKKYLSYGGSRFRKYCGLPAGSAWCDAYVTTIFHEAGNASLFCDSKKQTYCPTTIKWCYNNLASIPPYLALPSDIIFFDWELNGVPNHIGFVRERKDCDTIYTIEGNTSGSICAQKTRNTKYVQGIFRPHFKASYKLGTLEIDGLMGYSTIAMLQTALKAKGTYSGAVDGILGKGTVKGVQKLCGVTADGLWGKGTSKAVQKMVGATADGLFGKNSVKALQTWINKVTAGTPSTWVDNANAWARKIAGEKYHYVRWKSGITATHTCPICNGRKYDNYYGWNCIGFAFAVWHHGGGLKNKCSCGVISSGKGGQWDRLLKDSQATANANATKWTGVPCTVIRNGGKALTRSMLKAGDILCMYNNGTAQHIIYYMGNGKFAESNSSGSADKHIRADLTLSNSWLSKIKVAVRYTGK